MYVYYGCSLPSADEHQTFVLRFQLDCWGFGWGGWAGMMYYVFFDTVIHLIFRFSVVYFYLFLLLPPLPLPLPTTPWSNTYGRAGHLFHWQIPGVLQMINANMTQGSLNGHHLKVVTWNVRGLGGQIKRSKVLTFKESFCWCRLSTGDTSTHWWSCETL